MTIAEIPTVGERMQEIQDEAEEHFRIMRDHHARIIKMRSTLWGKMRHCVSWRRLAMDIDRRCERLDVLANEYEQLAWTL